MQLHYLARHGRLAAVLLVVGMLTLGCSSDPTAPPANGAIRAVVTTTGSAIDRDPDGYTMSIDGGPGQTLTSSGQVTFADLQPGNHLVHLGGLAANCSVGGANPRPVDVAGGAPAPVIVSFSVSCIPRVGGIHVSTATSGPDQDADGYVVIVTGVGGGPITANGTRDFSGVHEGPVAVELSGISGNCVVDGANPQTVSVPFAGWVNAVFTIRCAAAGSLRVTTVTTGAYLDPNGYELDIRPEEASSGTRISVSTNESVTVPGLLGNYVLTLFEIMPNCDVMQNPLVVTVVAGSPSLVTLDVTCNTPRELAFVSVASGNADISIMASNGGGAHRITAQPLSDVDPAWSPDGSRIAFTSERDGNLEIYVMNADGTNPVRLTNGIAPDSRPAWSPDGARIAFASTRDGNSEIYVMNADGANPVRLTNHIGYDADPEWSPDGSRVAFSSDREGGGGIWVMNANGSGLVRLTTNSRRDLQPAWSPDGTRIAFSRESYNGNNIFIINTDGSGLTQLTSDIANAADPAWSPDGRKIAFGAAPTYCGWYEYYCDPSVMVISTDGVLYSSLTTFASNPAWRP